MRQSCLYEGRPPKGGGGGGGNPSYLGQGCSSGVAQVDFKP